MGKTVRVLCVISVEDRDGYDIPVVVSLNEPEALALYETWKLENLPSDYYGDRHFVHWAWTNLVVKKENA